MSQGSAPSKWMRVGLDAPSPRQLWILVFVSTLSWSFGPVCTRLALDQGVPPTLVAAGRMVAGALLFTPWALGAYRRDLVRMPRRSLMLAIVAGILFAVNITLISLALQLVGVVISQALIATIPIWVAIMEVALLGARFSRALLMGVCLAILGGGMIALAAANAAPAMDGGNPALGVGIAAVSAFSAAMYIIIGRSQRRSTAFIPYVWLVYASGSVATLLIILFSRTSLVGYTASGYVWVLLAAITAQIIGHGVLNYALKFLTATALTMTAQLMPVLSVLWGLLLLREAPTAGQIAGCVIIVLGVFIVLRAPHRLKMPTG